MLIESPAFLSSKQALRHSKALSAFSNEWLPSTLHNSRQHLITYCASVSASILLGGDDLAQHVFYFPCGTSVVPGGEGGCPIRSLEVMVFVTTHWMDAHMRDSSCDHFRPAKKDLSITKSTATRHGHAVGQWDTYSTLYFRIDPMPVYIYIYTVAWIRRAQPTQLDHSIVTTFSA